MSGTPWSEIDEICGLDGEQRDLAVNAFLADDRHQALFRKITENLCNRYRIHPKMSGDDVHNIVQKVARRILVDETETRWAHGYATWSVPLMLRAQDEVKAFSERSGR